MVKQMKMLAEALSHFFIFSLFGYEFILILISTKEEVM